MSKSKVNMPKELKRKCNIIIHSATGASAVAGLIPIPMSDAIPYHSSTDRYDYKNR